MILLGLINLRGVGESVKLNVVFTCVELTGLMIVIAFGAWALSAGQGDLGCAFNFELPGDRGLFQAVMAGTTLAFFAMGGFEDSVNMVEGQKETNGNLLEELGGGQNA